MGLDLADRPVALRVQGEYWHGAAFPGRQAQDDRQAQRLRALGYIVADLWEEDVYQAALYDRVGAYVRGEVGRAL